MRRSSARLLAMLTATAAIFTLSAMAFAFSPGHGPGFVDPQARLEGQIEALELDDQTRDTIYSILDQSRAGARELRERVRDAHADLRTLLEQDEPSEAAVMTQADVVGELTIELRKQQLSTMLAVAAQLTPEQREQLRSSLPDGPPAGGCRH